MSFSQRSLTLTAAGIALLASAAASNQKLKVTRVAFGDSLEAPAANTTGIGNVLQEATLHTQGVSLLPISFTVQSLFDGIGVISTTSGMVGVWIDDTLIGAASHVMKPATVGNQQVALRGVTNDTSPLANANITSAASLLGDLYVTNITRAQEYIGNGSAINNMAIMGSPEGNTHNELCEFVNILLDANEMFTYNAEIGTSAYYLVDMLHYTYNGTSWVRTPGNPDTLTDLVKPGVFYRSDLTNSLYYVVHSGRFIRVSVL